MQYTVGKKRFNMSEISESSSQPDKEIRDRPETPSITIERSRHTNKSSKLEDCENFGAFYMELKNSLGILDWMLLHILKCGRIPKHVAFIMDGNRRFARSNAIDTAEGHSVGFEKMMQVLFWCQLMGVREVTVYAFSIENFKRSPWEVSTLMNVALERCWTLIKQKEGLVHFGIRIRVAGKMDMLPKDLQVGMQQLVDATQTKTAKITLNISMAYTSREEMTNAIRTAAKSVKEGLLSPDDINEALLDECMYVKPNVDLLVRTSGEVRLSDFMLWQSAFSVLHFTSVLWPEFSFRNFCAAIFNYQNHYRYVTRE